MNVQKIFREQRAAIVEGWINAVYSTYPLQTTGFLRTKNDPFTNPVGDMTKEAAGLIYDVIAGEHVTPQKIKHALDRFVRLRAVQQYTPSQGLGVFFLSVTLLAFDLYSAARETLAETRIAEIRNQHAQLVRWAQSVDGSPVSGKS